MTHPATLGGFLMRVLEEWQRVREVLEEQNCATFVPVTDGELDALRRQFLIPDEVGVLLREGYPERPVKLLNYAVFPAISELLAWRTRDAAWPRHWWPLRPSVDHFVLYVASGPSASSASAASTTGIGAPRGVCGLWNDSDLEGGSYLPGEQYYQTLEAFLRAVATCARHLRPHSFENRTEGGRIFKSTVRVLKPAVAEAMRRDYAMAESGPAVLPYLQNGEQPFVYDAAYAKLFHV
jgi:hypothetical protein